MGGGGKGKVSITVGYRYYVGLHTAICEASRRLCLQ